MKKVFVIGLLCCLTMGVYAASTPSWRIALQKANQEVDNRGSLSPLGVFVGDQVQRISKQTQVQEWLAKEFNLLKQRGHTTCEANYKRLGNEMRKNKLFARYEISALVPGDFCDLDQQDMSFLMRFFQNKQNPLQAVQYQKLSY